jgi:uncharacterized protein
LPWKKLSKFAAIVVIAIGAQQYLINKLLFGTMFSPEFPRPVVIAMNIAFTSILLLMVFQLLLDIGLVMLAILKRKRVFLPHILRFGIIILALSLASFGVSQAIVIPEVKQVEIEIENLPKSFEGYRLVQLTDLHISKLFQAPWVAEVVEKTNALNADAIVITGDLIDGSITQRQKDIAPLNELRAKDGIYIIPGNHEYYFGYENWMKAFAAMNMQDLSNRHTLLRKGEDSIILAGVVDSTSTRMGLEGPDLNKALQNTPDATPIILLDHKPGNAAEAAAKGVDLQLSGHTHGGMVRGFDYIVAHHNGGFVSGCYQVDQMQLYVNNGTALWLGFAIRLGIPPELTLITLRNKRS